MATFNFTNQQDFVDTLLPYLQTLKTEMNNRRTLWDKIKFEKKKAWIQSEKDPVINLAWGMYKDLNDFFTGGKGVKNNFDL